MTVVLWSGAEQRTLDKIIGPLRTSLPPGTSFYTQMMTGMMVAPGPGDVVLAMGLKAMEVLRSQGLVPKGRTLSYMRETPIPRAAGGHWLVTYDPGAADKDPEVTGLIQWDVRLAARLSATGSILPAIGAYRYAPDLSAIRAHLEMLHASTGAPVPATLDLETMGLHPYYADKHILTVQASAAEGTADVVRVDKLDMEGLSRLIDDLRWLLNTPWVRLRGANLKFDLIWLLVKWGIECTNYTMDTTIVGSLLDETRSNSLNAHAKIYTEMGGYDDPLNLRWDKGRMELALAADPDGFLTYAGGDTDACLRVSNVMLREMSLDRALQRFYVKLLHPAARAFEKIEARGVVVDRQKMAQVRATVQADVTRLEGEALALMPRRLRLKYADNLSLTRPALLKDFFFSPLGLGLRPKILTPKDQQPSTARDHLMMFGDVPEARAFVDVFEKWGVATKTLGTFIDGFMEHVRPDGRFHPTYFLHAGEGEGDIEGGTNTGRLSCKGPPMQVMPKHTLYAHLLRTAYVAPPGHVFWEADFDQGELKIMACQADERNMLEAYARKMDLHAKTGGELSGHEYEEVIAGVAAGDKHMKFVRQKGKPANFGLIYDISVGGYREYARKSYRVELTEEEAEHHHRGFFELYPGIHPYHQRQREHARRHGFVRSPLGRVRHLPLIHSRDGATRGKEERRAINAPTQSTLSDMLLESIHLLAEQYPDLWIAGMTHDSMYGYAPADEADVWMSRITGTMENLPLHEFDWEPQLQFTASGGYGDSWATVD